MTWARQPPQHVIDFSIEVAQWSPCQSKRGVVIFSGDDILGHGYNYKPRGFDCDGSDTCKATCRAEAIHAEQQALLGFRNKAQGADMLHVKSVNGVLAASGGPSCVQCSKLAVVCGIANFWLFHESGWRRYEMAEFHRLSIGASNGLAEVSSPATPQPVTGDTSDGYHTFNELYDYRKAYNALLFNEWASRGVCDVHKSWHHSDGEACFGGGWFIVSAQTPTGQITNHYETADWELFRVPERELAAAWDGHTPAIALERLLTLAAAGAASPATPALEQIIETWRNVAIRHLNDRKGLRRNTPANAFKEGLQVALIDCARELQLALADVARTLPASQEEK